jgi:murein DD-endopeptidase MepM/ murein hydrolase activator NlpD
MRRTVVILLLLAAVPSAALPARAQEATPSPAASASPSPSPSPTTKAERVSQARDAIRKSQEAGLISLLTEADRRRARIEETLIKLQVVLDDVQRKLFEVRAKHIQAQVELERTQLALTDAQNSLASSRAELAENAAGFYMRGTLSDAFAIMNAQDMADVASAQVYMQSVLDTSSAAIMRFHAAEQRLTAAKERVEQRARELERQAADLEVKEAEVLDLLGRQERSRHQLIVTIADRADALAALTNERNGFQTIVRSYDRGSAAIRQLVTAAQDGQPVAKPADREVLRPVPGRITSPFGWRTHPIYKYRSYHTGVDLQAPYGAEIHAARAGTVLAVDYVGAFGLLMIIDHGDRIATMYAHLSRSAVSPGDRVAAGEAIGLVGCTGWCTGPHLHFEVWFQSKPENPVYWF